MMSLRCLALLAAFAGIATCSPLTPALASSTTLEAREIPCPGNGTIYYGDSSGAVCLYRPSDCTQTYQVKSGDTCSSIVSQFGSFTYSIFYYWNPDIAKDCLSLRAYVPVCIATPWYKFTPPVQRPSRSVVDIKTVAATEQPIPQMPVLDPLCSKFYLVGSDAVSSIARRNNISLDDFYKWNPAIDPQAPVAWKDYYVCVGGLVARD